MFLGGDSGGETKKRDLMFGYRLIRGCVMCGDECEVR